MAAPRRLLTLALAAPLFLAACTTDGGDSGGNGPDGGCDGRAAVATSPSR